MAVAHRRASARPRPTTTTRSAGRTRWTRRTSGPSRSPRTGAAPATARSSTGPNGIDGQGRAAHQFHHVIDVAADGARGGRAAGARRSSTASSRCRCTGVSMAYSFDDADAAERHETQYFEMFGNRGIYHKGWTAVTRHSTPWVMAAELPPLDDDVWELYDTRRLDPGARPRRASSPSKLHELQRLFLIEAAKYNVLPLDDRRVERFNADLAGRPQLDPAATRQLLFGGMGRLTENSVRHASRTSRTPSRRRSWCPRAAPSGVIVAQGGAFGGWSLYAQRRPAGLLLQPVRPAALQGRRRRGASRPASTRCGWSSPTTAAASARAARSTLFVDGDQGRRGPRRRHRADALLGRRDHRRRQGQRHAGERRLDRARAASPGACAGSRSTSATTPRTPTTSSRPRSA